MTPRAFNKAFRYDKRLVTGKFFPQEPVGIVAGDRVGVVLLNPGGPIKPEDIEPFLYNRFMDPACIDLPVKGTVRHWASKFFAARQSSAIGACYDAVGGASPINRLTEEQRVALERRLNDRFARATGASFRCYTAARYWKPTPEETGAQMVRDGITKVVLLPLYPHYSKATTGSSLLYWKALEDTGEIPVWPTSSVFEYAAHPKYIQAISERIDEGLQRFSRAVRDKVHLLFSAHGTPAKAMKQRRDPYCCLVHATVQQVMDYRRAERERDRAHLIAFRGHQGPSEGLTPNTPNQLEELAEQGHTSVLVVPVAFVTDHLETAYNLDIEVREKAETFGIEHYEVTRGLNAHPLFIEALAEVVAAQLSAPDPEGDGAPVELPTPWARLPLLDHDGRAARCHQCRAITEARDWSTQVPTEVAMRPSSNA